jgi:hypothetical protein
MMKKSGSRACMHNTNGNYKLSSPTLIIIQSVPGGDTPYLLTLEFPR